MTTIEFLNNWILVLLAAGLVALFLLGFFTVAAFEIWMKGRKR